jgi:hypothetical protein
MICLTGVLMVIAFWSMFIFVPYFIGAISGKFSNFLEADGFMEYWLCGIFAICFLFMIISGIFIIPFITYLIYTYFCGVTL